MEQDEIDATIKRGSTVMIPGHSSFVMLIDSMESNALNIITVFMVMNKVTTNVQPYLE